MLTAYLFRADCTVKKVRLPDNSNASICQALGMDPHRGLVATIGLSRKHALLVDEEAKVYGAGPNLLAGFVAGCTMELTGDGVRMMHPGDYIAGDALLVFRDPDGEVCSAPDCRFALSRNGEEFTDQLLSRIRSYCRDGFFSSLFGKAYTGGMEMLLRAATDAGIFKKKDLAKDQNGEPVPQEVLDFLESKGIDPSGADFIHINPDDGKALSEAIKRGESQEAIDRILEEAKRRARDLF